jgi:hypothetical protein
MMKTLILACALTLAGCATPIAVGSSPEAQIQTGAQSVTAATALATVALRDHKITVTTAKSYRNMLAAAGESLKDANTELEQCRKDTGSTQATSPDPCWPKVSYVVTIALQNIAGVRTALAAK